MVSDLLWRPLKQGAVHAEAKRLYDAGCTYALQQEFVAAKEVFSLLRAERCTSEERYSYSCRSLHVSVPLTPAPAPPWESRRVRVEVLWVFYRASLRLNWDLSGRADEVSGVSQGRFPEACAGS